MLIEMIELTEMFPFARRSRSSRWCSTVPWTRTTLCCTKLCWGLRSSTRPPRSVPFAAPSSSSTTTTTTTTSNSSTPWGTRSRSRQSPAMTCRFETAEMVWIAHLNLNILTILDVISCFKTFILEKSSNCIILWKKDQILKFL